MKKLYLWIALAITPFSYSQQTPVSGPGGVPGAVLWMKTVPLTTDWNGSYR